MSDDGFCRLCWGNVNGQDICDDCDRYGGDADSDGEDIATADERRRLYTYIGKVRDMHPLAAGEVTA